MDFVLSYRVFDVVVLDLLTPVVVKVVDLAGHLPALLQVVGLVDLRIASFSEDRQDQVAVL